jgi:hypothetical protein
MYIYLFFIMVYTVYRVAIYVDMYIYIYIYIYMYIYIYIYSECLSTPQSMFVWVCALALIWSICSPIEDVLSWVIYMFTVRGCPLRFIWGTLARERQTRVSLFGFTWSMCSLRRVSFQAHMCMFTVGGCPLEFIWGTKGWYVAYVYSCTLHGIYIHTHYIPV